MAGRVEIDLEETGKVVGGCYVNTSMTIGQIIGTNSNLFSILAQAGISAAGNKALMGMTLYEAASMVGVDPNVLVDRMNDYLN